MSAKKKPVFGSVAAPLIHAGFSDRDLLPLVPPDASISARSKQLKPGLLGKIPGRYVGGGEWIGLSGQHLSLGLDRATIAAAAEWPTVNAGLRSADFPCVDIDTDDEDAAHMARAVLNRVIPATITSPERYRDNAARVLYPFKLAADTGPSPNLRRLEWLDAKKVRHVVEVLGSGRQYVVEGIHPSGEAYKWRDGKSLAVVGPDKLPELTNELVEAYFNSLVEAIVAARGTLVSRTGKRIAGLGGEEIEFEKAEPVMPGELILEAPRRFPQR